MTAHDLITLLPLEIIFAGSVLLILLASFIRGNSLSAAVSIISLVFAASAIPFCRDSHAIVRPLLALDDFACIFLYLLLAAAFVTAVFLFDYLRRFRPRSPECFILLLFASLGSAVLVSSTHFISFFLGLELLSISLYAMIAYLRSEHGIEAGLKYLVLAGLSSAFLLMGFALLYSHTGTMDLRLAAPNLSGMPAPLLAAAAALILIAIGFKLGLVPFHLWTPDVYAGSPAPVAGFIATASKGAIIALLLRYGILLGILSSPPVVFMVSLLAAASMLAGSLLALFQPNVKRMLAYSSIAHMGYILIVVLAAGTEGVIAATFYLLAYFVTTLIAFGVISVLSSGSEYHEGSIANFRSLAARRPFLAICMTASLLSLAGLPITAGFIAKFYLLWAGIRSGFWLLAAVLIISSATGLFYYLRVIAVIYARQNDPVTGESKIHVSLAIAVLLAILVVLLVIVGVYPQPVLDYLSAVVNSLISN
jgi:NADH-quinone oxidoreductase subunit N